MLHTHTKFIGNQLVGSGKEGIKRILPYMGVAVIFGHVSQMPRTKFRSTYPWRLHIQSGFDLPNGFGRIDVVAL